MENKKSQFKFIASLILILLLIIVCVGAIDADWTLTRYVHNITGCTTLECNRTGGNLLATVSNLQTENFELGDLYRITVQVIQSVDNDSSSLSADIQDVGLDNSFLILENNNNIFDFEGVGVTDSDSGDGGNIGVDINNWWNSSWGYRREITLEETGSIARINEPLEIDISNLKLYSNDCWELRIVNNNTEVAYDLLDNSGETNEFGSQECLITFLVNLSVNENISYYVYYGNHFVSFPNYNELNFFYETFDSYSINDNLSPDDWEVISGTWKIVSDNGNKVLRQDNTSDIDHPTVLDDNFDDFMVEVKVKQISSYNSSIDNNGIFFRYTNINNRYGTYLNGPDEDKIVLDKKINGNFSYMGGGYGTWEQSFNDWTHLNVLANGTNFKSNTNYSSLVLEGSDNTFTNGHIALFSRSSIAYFDDFKVWPNYVNLYKVPLAHSLGSEEAPNFFVRWNPASGVAMGSMGQNEEANFSYILNPRGIIGSFWFNFSAEGGANDAVISNKIGFIDTISPVIILNQPLDGASGYNGSVLFSYNVLDRGSNIASCSLYINDSLNQTDSSIFEDIMQYFFLDRLSDGDYFWKIRCIDDSNSSNIAYSSNRTFTVLDIKAPIITLLGPVNNTNSTDDDFFFEYAVFDSAGDVANCSLIVNGVITATDSNIHYPLENFSLYNLSSGKYNWSVLCVDDSPNKNSGTSEIFVLNVSVETEPPLIHLVSPENGYTDKDGLLYFIFNATDLNNVSGLSSCKLIIDDAVDQIRTDFSEGSAQTFNTTLGNGDYTWSVNCTDDYWNEGSSNPRSVTVSIDTSAPVITLLSPADDTLEEENNTIIFSFTVSDDSGLDNCSLIIDNIINQTDYNPSIETNNITKTLTNGDYVWRIECFDNLSNSGSSATAWNLSIDTNPTITLDGPPDESKDTDGNVNFNFTVNDNTFLRKCSLYTNISDNWSIAKTNTFIQKNKSIPINLYNLTDERTIIWNIGCMDVDYNIKWANSNYTLIINNSPPSYSTISPLSWDEDNYTIINLSEYFSDSDGDALRFVSSEPENIDININGETATLISEKNWYGSSQIIFYAYDVRDEYIGSGNVSISVTQVGDTNPRIVDAGPFDGYNDLDGFVFFNCNVSDDLSLANVSLYTNSSGSWEVNQTKSTSGDEGVVIFNITDLTDTSFKWNCLVFDSSSQSSWGTNKTLDVDITVNLEHDVSNWIVNDVNHSRFVVLSYSSYLNNTLNLGSLTIVEDDGESYYFKDMSNVSSFGANGLIYVSQKIDIIPYDIFDENFNVGNKAGLNFSISYTYKGNNYITKTNITIEILNETRWG